MSNSYSEKDKFFLDYISLRKTFDVLAKDIKNNQMTMWGITQAMERLLNKGLSKGLIHTPFFNNHTYEITILRDEMFDKLNEITLRG